MNKEISMDEFNEKVTRMEKQNTDWFKILARNAVSQNYSLSLSGGNDKAQFLRFRGFQQIIE